MDDGRFRLAGKVCAISGIGSGQGHAAAVLFAEHGAKVVGCDLTSQRAEVVADEAQRRGDGGRLGR